MAILRHASISPFDRPVSRAIIVGAEAAKLGYRIAILLVVALLTSIIFSLRSPWICRSAH